MNKPALTFIHLRRSSGEPLILFDFDERKLRYKDIEDAAWQGFYGSEPRAETVTWIRQRLYRLGETVLLTWDRDKRFLVRFLLGFAAFMLTYFGLSLVVRLPMHFALRLLIALGVGATAFFVLRRREEKAGPTGKLLIIQREQIDRTTFAPSDWAERWEADLVALEALPEADLLDRILVSEGELRSAEAGLDPFSPLFGRYLGDLRDFLHRHRRDDRPTVRPALKRFLKNRRIDLPLFCLALKP